MDPETVVIGGKLKLKGGTSLSKKLGDKKKATKKVDIKKVDITITKKEDKKSTKTPTQLAFDKKMKETAEKRMLEETKVTYKDKINKLNEKLENLTEFNDIPKVSWTK
uniref:Protein FAM32A n=1 Tax=Rhabditophanes sp. KR3021 TaxID=114890 RepID=A0AC35U8R0_9BILA